MVSQGTQQVSLRGLLSWRHSSPDSYRELVKRLDSLNLKIVIRMVSKTEFLPTSDEDLALLPDFAVPDEWGRIGVSVAATREFSLFEKTPEFTRVKAAMLLMQNRHDFTGSFRVLEREVRIRRILLRVFTVLLEKNPDFAIFDVTPHDHIAVGVEGVLRWLGIPVLFFQPSLVGPQSLPRTSITGAFPYRISTEITEEFAQELSEVVDLARGSVLRLESGRGTPKVSSQKQREVSARTLRGRFKSLRFVLSRLSKGLHFPSVNFAGHTVLPPWFTRPLEVILDWSLRRSLVTTIFSLPSQIPETRGKFALFALHYEPERSSIPEGYPYSSQVDAVIRARSLLPDDVVLIVKEHFSQSAAALRGTLGRSPETYRMLEDIPGVKVLGIKANTPELITRAECVFTLTGKVGIEAALKGTPVVFGGQPWWEDMPGSAPLPRFTDDSDLAVFVKSPRPSRDEVFDWLSTQFANTLIPVLGDATVERYSERISQLPTRFAELQLEVVVEVIETFVRRNVIQ